MPNARGVLIDKLKAKGVLIDEQETQRVLEVGLRLRLRLRKSFQKILKFRFIKNAMWGPMWGFYFKTLFWWAEETGRLCGGPES